MRNRARSYLAISLTAMAVVCPEKVLCASSDDTGHRVYLDASGRQSISVPKDAVTSTTVDLCYDPVARKLYDLIRDSTGTHLRCFDLDGKAGWDIALPAGYEPYSCLFVFKGELSALVLATQRPQVQRAIFKIGSHPSVNLSSLPSGSLKFDQSLEPSHFAEMHALFKQLKWPPAPRIGIHTIDPLANIDVMLVNAPFVDDILDLTADLGIVAHTWRYGGLDPGAVAIKQAGGGYRDFPIRESARRLLAGALPEKASLSSAGLSVTLSGVTIGLLDSRSESRWVVRYKVEDGTLVPVESAEGSVARTIKRYGGRRE